VIVWPLLRWRFPSDFRISTFYRKTWNPDKPGIQREKYPSLCCRRKLVLTQQLLTRSFYVLGVRGTTVFQAKFAWRSFVSVFFFDFQTFPAIRELNPVIYSIPCHSISCIHICANKYFYAWSDGVYSGGVGAVASPRSLVCFFIPGRIPRIPNFGNGFWRFLAPCCGFLSLKTNHRVRAGELAYEKFVYPFETYTDNRNGTSVLKSHTFNFLFIRCFRSFRVDNVQMHEKRPRW